MIRKPYYYPRRNLIGIEPQWQLRRLDHLQFIDLLESPLLIADFLRRPLTRRGRWLIRAYDIDAKAWRQFYECSFRDSFRSPTLQIGKRTKGRAVAVSRPYEATVEDRRKMAMTLHRLKSHAELCVIATDLRVLRAG